MKALLWKDFRNNGKLWIASLVLLVMPYLATVVIAVVVTLGNADGEFTSWGEHFYGASVVSLMMATLLCAFVAGNAFAGERADRSAEFLAYLPIPRRDSLLSKTAIALSACVAFWMANGAVYAMTDSVVGDWSREGMQTWVRMLAATSVFVFGVSWLVSVMARSPGTAAATGLGSVLILFAIIGTVATAYDATGDAVFRWYIGLCLILGVLGVVMGMAQYLRRQGS